MSTLIKTVTAEAFCVWKESFLFLLLRKVFPTAEGQGVLDSKIHAFLHPFPSKMLLNLWRFFTSVGIFVTITECTFRPPEMCTSETKRKRKPKKNPNPNLCSLICRHVGKEHGNESGFAC